MKVTFYRGLPGSGKSTAARKTGMPVIEADDFFMVREEYKFAPHLIGYAHDWAVNELARMLHKGHDVCVANTFTQKWELAAYLKVAWAFGAQVEVICVHGNWGSTHGVPPETVEKMRTRWEEWEGEKHM
jgi:hypothetical protein